MTTEHDDKVTAISGANPRFTLRRHLEGYAYPQNGNVHNPTPRYRWHLLVDGEMVDSAFTRRTMVIAARSHGSDYLAEIDARKAAGA